MNEYMDSKSRTYIAVIQMRIYARAQRILILEEMVDRKHYLKVERKGYNRGRGTNISKEKLHLMNEDKMHLF